MADCFQTSVHDLPGLALHRIFHALGPRDLAVASSVCSLWRQHGIDSLSDRLWQSHYTERWQEVSRSKRTDRWQVHYGAKQQQLGSYRGCFQHDRLSGHVGAVRCVALQPAHNLLVTGSADRTVRLWDLQAGIPRAVSRRLGGTVRGVAVDEDMLVAGTSQDDAVRVWRSDSGRAAFDLQAPKKLTQHTGPVSSVALSAANIFSGSWDYSVRVWSRATLKQLALLSFPDWVDCLAPRGAHLLVAAGSSVYVHSLATAQRITTIACAPGSVDVSARLCIEGRRDSRLLFTGSASGEVSAYDLRSPSSRPAAAVLGRHAEPVAALAFEDPWLAVAQGSVTLVDVDAAMRGGRYGLSGGKACHKRQAAQDVGDAAAVTTRQLPAHDARLHCVDLADQFAAAGAKSGAVQTFDFSGAAAAAERSQAARRMRRSARQARAEHNAQRLAAASARAHASSAVFASSDAPLSLAAAGAAELPAGVQLAVRGGPAAHPVAETQVALPAAAGGSCLHDVSPASIESAADSQEAEVQEAVGQPPDSSPSAQLQKRVPQWRIIRPQRCKYRHMDHMAADPYDDVEVGA